jgi:hypothetical protein
MISRIFAALGVLGMGFIYFLACIGLARLGVPQFIIFLVISFVGFSLYWVPYCLIAGEAFTESAVQGLCCIFVPFYCIFYAGRTNSSHATMCGIGLLITIGVRIATAIMVPDPSQLPQNNQTAQAPEPFTSMNDSQPVQFTPMPAPTPIPQPYVPPVHHYTPHPPPHFFSSQEQQDTTPNNTPGPGPFAGLPMGPRGMPRRFGMGGPPAGTPMPQVETPQPNRMEAATFAGYVAQNYFNWIGDDSSLVNNMHWLPIAKRPTMGLRWGLGVTFAGVTTRKDAKIAADLLPLTGPIGPDLVRQLEQRLDERRDGEWAFPNGQFMRVPAFSAETEEDLMTKAAKENLDGLVLISMTSKRMGMAKTLRITMIVRLVDVLGHKITWSSSPLNSQKAQSTQGTKADASVQLVGEVMAKLDEQYASVKFPAIGDTAVQRRAAHLAESGGSPPQVLRNLAELRYYQAKKLLSESDAERAYHEIVGEKAKVLAGGDGTQRTAAAAEWWQSQN